MNLKHRPEQEIIAVDKQGQQVLFLDPANLNVRAAITGLPSRPHELLVIESLRKAYVPIYGDGVHGDNPHPNHQVAVIDLDSRRLTGFIDTLPYVSPHTGRLGRDGRVYLCCENSATLLIIDPRLDKVVGHIDVASDNVHRLIPLPHADQLWAESEEDRQLYAIDLQGDGGEVVATLQMPGPLNGIDASPLQPWVLATDADRPLLYVVDTDQRSLLRTLELPGHQHPGQVVRFSPDGRLIAVIGDFEPIVSFFDENLQWLFNAQLGDKPLDGCFSPAQDYLLVANENDATVSVIDIIARKTLGHVPVGKGCEILAYFNR
ncbi:WD40 repeat domain-containing protein [Pseudomonas sp. dw_358]|uniref:YncE family protein n=1 Tax=Pseudomonas sp. dw_358 TaxID=2720083 RepID=UPI001BD39E52|nr:WD40 repeat domain-containing protein [Pseudomonas sp. dw_358]